PKLQVGCHGKERRKPFAGWETRRARRTALFIFCLTRRNRDTLARDASLGRHRPAAARPAARPPHLPHPGAAAGTRPARCARARSARPPDAHGVVAAFAVTLPPGCLCSSVVVLVAD